MGRVFALLMVVALVPACGHMGKGGGGGSNFGHSSWGGGGGGGHAPSSSLGSSSHSSHSPSLAQRTTDGVADTAKAVGAALLEGALLQGEETTVTVAPVTQAPDPDAVGDLCLDCPDPGNCNSCPAGPRGAP